jgi:squalene synthase HpnC
VAVAPRTRGADRPGDAVQQTYAWCRKFASGRQENFTVISWMLPAAIRPHFAALYTFCRMTDDLGDEAEGDRLAQLDEWEQRLRACFSGDRTDPLFIALGATIDRFDIPADPFLRLIEANRMDQRITRFATYEELLHYCSFSATPVGQMVLYVLGYRDEARQQLSDATCIGLQLANFWQDVTVDLKKGRVYLPQEDLERFGVAEAELSSGEASPAFQDLMRFEVERAQALFDRGKALEGMVDRRARLDVRLFRLGGEATLHAIASAGYDVLRSRPRVSKQRKAWMAVSNGVRLKLGV